MTSGKSGLPGTGLRGSRLALPLAAGILGLLPSGGPAPAQTVIESLHYQAELELSCSGRLCLGRFARPGNKRRLSVTRVTCVLAGNAGSGFDSGYLELRDAADESVGPQQYLPADYSSPSGRHTLDSALDLEVGARQRLFVSLSVSGMAANAYAGVCTASGQLQQLE